MIFRRRETRDERELEDGEYHQATGQLANGVYALLRCPLCHKTQSVGIGRNHRVADCGTVSPSYVCAFPPCTFHTSIVLADWNPEMVSPRGRALR